jgi:hypothetical protein
LLALLPLNVLKSSRSLFSCLHLPGEYLLQSLHHIVRLLQSLHHIVRLLQYGQNPQLFTTSFH